MTTFPPPTVSQTDPVGVPPPGSACCHSPVSPPSLADDGCTHSDTKAGSDPGLLKFHSSKSGGQKNSCDSSSRQTKPAPRGSSADMRVAGPPEGPVGGQGDCAPAEAPVVAIIAPIRAAIIRTIIRRLMLSATSILGSVVSLPVRHDTVKSLLTSEALLSPYGV
jgi:hypothetical protein